MKRLVATAPNGSTVRYKHWRSKFRILCGSVESSLSIERVDRKAVMIYLKIPSLNCLPRLLHPPPIPRTHIHFTLNPHPLLRKSGAPLSFDVSARVKSLSMLTPVHLHKSSLHHFYIEVLSVHGNHPEDSAVPVLAKALNIDPLVQDQTSKIFRGLLAEGLTGFVLSSRDFWGVNTNKPDGHFVGSVSDLDCVAIADTRDLELLSL